MQDSLRVLFRVAAADAALGTTTEIPNAVGDVPLLGNVSESSKTVYSKLFHGRPISPGPRYHSFFIPVDDSPIKS